MQHYNQVDHAPHCSWWVKGRLRCPSLGFFYELGRGSISCLVVWGPLPILQSRVAVADYHKMCKQFKDQVCSSKYNPKMIFVLLLNTAQFEFLLKEVRIEEGGKRGLKVHRGA